MAAGPPGIVIARSEATKQARWFWQTYNRDCLVPRRSCAVHIVAQLDAAHGWNSAEAVSVTAALLLHLPPRWGAELALGNPQVASSGSLYGFTVNQYAAYDSRYLLASVLPRSTARSGWGQG
jgi:hypothetical protein